ncbi:hemicentin-1-like [Hypomesus transpacificus]|uniref:hemicentin-1-like n=1 Tax=Hypomesus transpacificus TaxID=137520 RepID=UPI001F075B91|nr:hemicentin-1-like [Hypomesus transpacificus]
MAHSVCPALNYSSLSLQCTWPGGLPPPSLRWSPGLLAPGQEGVVLGQEGAGLTNKATVLQSGTNTFNNSLFTCQGSHPALNKSTQCTTRTWSPPGAPACFLNATVDNQQLMLSCSWGGGAPRALLWWEGPGGQQHGGGEENANILVLRSFLTQGGQAYTCHGKHPLHPLPQACTLKLVPVTKPYLLVNNTSPAEGSSAWLRCGLENGTLPVYYEFEQETQNGVNKTFGQGNSSLVNMTEINRNHTGWYRCIVRNMINQQQSDRIWLDVTYGPDIPQIDVTPYSVTERGYSALERETVSLLCQAQSNPPSQYVWFYNNSQVYTGPQFTITRILPTHTGIYVCLARNTNLNTSAQKIITLTVYYPPDGSPSCVVQPALNYSSLSLQCTWPGGLPPPSLRWSPGLLALGQEGAVLGQEGAGLTNNATVLQSGTNTFNNSLFTCQGSHPALNQSTQCTTRTWSPPGAPACFLNATVDNQQLMLSCSWGGGAPRALLWWEGPGGQQHGGGEENANILVLRSFLTQGGQAYTCHGKHPLHPLPQACTLKLVPVTKPSIWVSDASPVEGSSIGLRCGLANGTLPIYYEFEQETQNGVIKTFGQANSSLVNMTEINRNHTGWYRCSVRNTINQQRSDQIWLDVIYGPDIPQIDVTPYSVTERGYSALERETVSLLCQAQSNPPSQYVWFYNNSQVYTGPQFTITRILRTHTGIYTCLALNTNLNTRVRKTMTLTVYYPPDGSPSCIVQPALNYSSLSLQCTWPGGLPPPSLRWSPGLLAPGQEGAVLGQEVAGLTNNATVLQSGANTFNNSLFTCQGSHPALDQSTQCTSRTWSPSGAPVCFAYATRDNQQLMLSCSWGGGAPRALLWWEGPGGQQHGGGEENANILVLRSGSAQSGQAYTCRGKHPLHPLPQPCTLKLEAPVLLTQRSMVSVYEGSDVELSCILTANYPPAGDITWFNNRRQEVRSVPQKYLLQREAAWANLTVRETDGIQDSGQYWCSASNAVGGAEIPITLLVKRYPMPPNVTLVRLVYSTHQRSEVQIEWRLEGDGEGDDEVAGDGGLTSFTLERWRVGGETVPPGRKRSGEEEEEEEEEERGEGRSSSPSWLQVGEQGPDVRYHTLGNLIPTLTYQFRVTAVNHRTVGHPSLAKTPAAPPFNAYPAVIGAAIGGMILAAIATVLLFIFIIRNRNNSPRLHDMLFGMQHSQSRENINFPEDDVVARAEREGVGPDPVMASPRAQGPTETPPPSAPTLSQAKPLSPEMTNLST